MEQISTHRKKIVAGRYLIVLYFATLVDATPIIEKLAPRYNYIQYISPPLQFCGRQGRF
jgi:hypothetical protein